MFEYWHFFQKPQRRPLHNQYSQGYLASKIDCLKILWLFLTFLWLTCADLAQAQDGIHHGPSLQVQVKRGDTTLPLALVNRLHAGDTLHVKPEIDNLAKGEWVLMLAHVSPTGNQVVSKHFSLRELKGPAQLEITADNQVPIIILAPQLRNMFGLYTSLSESADLLKEILNADPQRFYDLQKVDQINQAIQTLSQSLTRSLSDRAQEDAILVTKDLAFKFGVRNLDLECFKNQVVNTECVATNIVVNKDFVLPNSSDLSSMVGNKKAVDLNSFLIANLRIFSEASDYLSNKYRDNYDLAPTFGRHQAQPHRIDLFSIARFRNGNIKTAYIYVPSWFTGATPSLLTDNRPQGCFTSGRLNLQVRGRLPLVNYWHDWHMNLRDPDTHQSLANISNITFEQETGRLSFELPNTSEWKTNTSQNIELSISTKFGFDTIKIDDVHMALPLSDISTVKAALSGWNSLISGERATLAPRTDDSAACLFDLVLTQTDGTVVAHNSTPQPRLSVDLQTVPPGPLQLALHQAGQRPLHLPVRVLQPQAKINRIEHAEGDDSLNVQGQRLERIARIDIPGRGSCTPSPESNTANSSRISFECNGNIRRNANLPATVQVVHQENEPGPIKVRLTSTPAIPRLLLATNTQNALLVSPSDKALQWNLQPGNVLMSEDSGLSVLLQVQSPYVLSKGSYQLQLRFKDDPESDAQPLSAPLIADFSHNELRSRSPLRFDVARLPSVVNPLEFRVLHKPSDQAGPWQPLGRTLVWVPDLQSISCSAQGDNQLLYGQRLDLIDAIQIPSENNAPPNEFVHPQLVPCKKGLCLSLPQLVPGNQLKIRIRWIDDSVFTVNLPKSNEVCPRLVSP